MKKSTYILAVGVVLLIGGVTALYVRKTAPSVSGPAGVSLLSHEILKERGATVIKGAVINRTSVPITYVAMTLACTSGQQEKTKISFTVGSRLENRRAENRTTGKSEVREYEVPERIGPGETYQFEHEIINEADTSSCTLTVDGFVNYQTITE